MNRITDQDIQDIMRVVHLRPSVSVILPVETKINLKTELAHSLKITGEKVERELKTNFPEETVEPLMKKFHVLVSSLDWNTRSRGIALYVSPVFAKIFYLDIPVQEKIVVDESFEIRDLVFARKEMQEYLVLIVSGKESKAYLVDNSGFKPVIPGTPGSVYAYVNDLPERTGNFSDISDRKETVTDKFLHHIDDSLDEILRQHPVPLFVLGTDRIAGHFKSSTRHAKSVAAYIHGNYEEASLPELKKLLEPYVTQWKESKQKDLMQRLEEAASQKKLAFGMVDVWSEAAGSRGRLLLVEKNYVFVGEHGSLRDVIYKADNGKAGFSLIKDAVDDVIEKVLAGGGDVEFVDDDVLKEYNHIALIQYY